MLPHWLGVTSLRRGSAGGGRWRLVGHEGVEDRHVRVFSDHHGTGDRSKDEVDTYVDRGR